MQVPSVPGQSLVRELAGEGGLTPLHLAAYSGSENVVRGLLNSPAVQVGRQKMGTNKLNYNEQISCHRILSCLVAK